MGKAAQFFPSGNAPHGQHRAGEVRYTSGSPSCPHALKSASNSWGAPWKKLARVIYTDRKWRKGGVAGVTEPVQMYATLRKLSM